MLFAWEASKWQVWLGDSTNKSTGWDQRMGSSPASTKTLAGIGVSKVVSYNIWKGEFVSLRQIYHFTFCWRASLTTAGTKTRGVFSDFSLSKMQQNLLQLQEVPLDEAQQSYHSGFCYSLYPSVIHTWTSQSHCCCHSEYLCQWQGDYGKVLSLPSLQASLLFLGFSPDCLVGEMLQKT